MREQPGLDTLMLIYEERVGLCARSHCWVLKALQSNGQVAFHDARHTSIHMNHKMCGCRLMHICRRKTLVHAAGWTRPSACSAAGLAQLCVDSSG